MGGGIPVIGCGGKRLRTDYSGRGAVLRVNGSAGVCGAGGGKTGGVEIVRNTPAARD